MGEPASQVQDSQTDDLASQLENLLGETAPAPADEEQAPTDAEPQTAAAPATPINSKPATAAAPTPTPAPTAAPTGDQSAPATRFIQGGEESSSELDAQVAQMLGDAISKVNEIREEADNAHTPQQDQPASPSDASEAARAPAPKIAEEVSQAPAPAASKVEEHGSKTIHEEVASHRSGFGPRAPEPAAAPAPHAAVASPTAGSGSYADQPAPAKPAPAPSIEPVAAKTPRRSLLAIIWSVLMAILRPLGRLLAGIASPLGMMFAKPLERQAPVVRDSIGWIAIVTVFMGACMWAAALLRDPKPFVPDVAPTTVVTEGGHGEGGHGGGHGEGGEKHGAAKKEEHGKKEAAHGEGGHGEGGHGEAAAPPVKREPLIQRGAAKKPAKKPEGGHGEHH